MQPRTLLLPGLAALLVAAAAWQLGGGRDGAQRASLAPPAAPPERDAARAADDVARADVTAPRASGSLAPELAARTPRARRAPLAPEVDAPRDERDELFADSPAPPEPGAYDGPLVREDYDDGTPLFEAEQTLGEDGLWRVDGRWTSYHENGQVRELGQYAHGVEDGDWRWFDDNGQAIAQGSFVDGLREGAWTFWYENGVKQLDAHYEGGAGAGHWDLYYDDGSPCASGSYVAGEISGYWTVWDEFGAVNPERTGWYEHGQRVPD